MPRPVPFGPFLGVEVAIDVTPDFYDEEGEIKTPDGGRGVYFDGPSGHILEIVTRAHGDAR